jgi:hypothetical protein
MERIVPSVVRRQVMLYAMYSNERMKWKYSTLTKDERA